MPAESPHSPSSYRVSYLAVTSFVQLLYEREQLKKKKVQLVYSACLRCLVPSACWMMGEHNHDIISSILLSAA